MTHLEINLLSANQLYANDFIPHKFLNDFLVRQSSVQHLKIRGLKFDEEIMEKFINRCKRLKTLELECKKLKNSWELLKAIKDHKSEQYWKHWTDLTFINVRGDLKKLVSQILANHREIKTLTFKYKYAIETIFPSIEYIKAITFKFSAEDHPSIEDFTKIHSLHVGPMYSNQMRLVVEFLSHCPNLKILIIDLDEGSLTPDVIRGIFEAVKDLVELHICGFLYLVNDNCTIRRLEALRTHGKNLKRLILADEKTELEILREQVKIFDDSDVQVIVMDYWLHDSDKLSSTSSCVYMK